MISRSTIDKVESLVKIEEVVGDFIPLKRKGKSYVGICPFHNDKSPSLTVTPHLGIYKCFACGAGGYAVKFVMEYEKMSYADAIRYLANKYNVEVEEDAPETPEQRAEQDEREALIAINDFADNFFISQLFDTEEGRDIGLAYFKERGFNEETIKRFHLGYCPASGYALVNEAKAKGYSLERMEHLGLVKKSEKGNYYDFYRGRVIFPILSHTGRPLGFGGRDLNYVKGVSKTGKYINSPENAIYHKRDVLYGFYTAKKAISENNNVYLVEGYTDVISLYQAGVKNVVASSGTMLTEGQVRMISRLTKNITVMYDGDNAGISAALRGIEMLLPAGLHARIIQLPPEHDPDSFARTHRDSELIEYLSDNATDFILFKARVLSKDVKDDPLKRAELVNSIVKNIADVDDVILRADYIKHCSEIFGYKEDVLNVALRKLTVHKMKKQKADDDTFEPQVQLPAAPAERETRFDTLASAEERILSLLLRYGIYVVLVPDRFSTEEGDYTTSRIDQYVFDELFAESISFSVPLHQKVYEEYAKIAETAQTQKDIAIFFARHEDAQVQKFAMDFLAAEEPSCSQEWTERFDVVVNSMSNHVGILGNELMNDINMLKLRYLEKFKEQLMKEFETLDSNEVELTDLLMAKLTQVNLRRSQLSDLMGIVVTK
ncbi:MAG: DNA primase [Bacteroidales bacterium]|nr:DNA primase [Bacteroidales bacterium]